MALTQLSMQLLIPFFLFSSGTNGFWEFHPYKIAKCGSVVDGSQGLLLPHSVSCELQVVVPPGQQMSFYEVTTPKEPFPCKKISVTNEATGERFPLCSNGQFVGQNGTYSLKINNLPSTTKLQVNFEKVEKNIFTCGELVPYERVLSPFTFSNDGQDSDGCPLLLLFNRRTLLRIEAEMSFDECGTRILITQGRTLQHMTKSTPEICLDQDGLDTEAVCGFVTIYLQGSPNTRVKVTTAPFPSKFPLDSVVSLNC